MISLSEAGVGMPLGGLAPSHYADLGRAPLAAFAEPCHGFGRRAWTATLPEAIIVVAFAPYVAFAMFVIYLVAG